MAEPFAIVLAAGKGTRMKSERPKVLIEVCNRPMIGYVLDALRAAGINRVAVVVGYEAKLVEQTLAGDNRLQFVLQSEQKGTGHAVMMCRDVLEGVTGPVVVVTGDSPLIQGETVKKLLDEFQASGAACVLGTVHRENPAGLGRIVRDENGNFAAIVEEKDATPRQKTLTEVNMSYYVFNRDDLIAALAEITPKNAQGEYYLTDCPGLLKQQGKRVVALPVLKPSEGLSINTLDELAAVEDALRASR